MTNSFSKPRIRRRGALLFLLSGLVAVSPAASLMATPALADKGSGGGDSGSGGGNDGGGDGGNDGGGSDGGGNDGGGGDGGGDDGGGDDGGGDDGGGDDGGDDDGGSDGGGSGGGGSGSGKSSSSNGKSGSAPASQAKDGDLAKRLKNRIAPVGEVEALARKAKPGEVIDVKLYRERKAYVYRVKVMQRSGSIYDLKFDAVTRRLLSVRER